MRRLKAWWLSIPRPVRIVRNMVLALILLALFYVFNGSPDLNPEQAYRRAAARNMVGPGEILGILEVDISGGYNRLLLAETDTGVVQYCYRYENLGFFKGNTFSSYEGDLIYREKEGPVTIMAATGEHYMSYRDALILPVILFDDVPGAVRAEVDLCLTGELNGVEYDYKYQLSTQRTVGGFFVFDLTSASGTDRENYAITQVSELYADSGGRGKSIPVTVRLYDKTNTLVHEGEVTLCSAADAAHAKREGDVKREN